jgi:MFS family permease
MQQPKTGTAAAGDGRLQKTALWASTFAMLMWSLDTAVTQVSLTAIQADLMMTVTASQWVLSLAIMAVAASVSIAGWLSDRRGAARILRWGLLIYLAATLIVMAAGFLRVSALLMAGRLAQGIGATLTFPTAVALVVTVYPAEQRGKAMGTMFAMTMLVTAVGSAVAGAIGDAAGGPWLT